MAQQGKQTRVGAREDFAWNSVKLVLLANSNRYEVHSETFFPIGRALYPFKVLLCSNSDLFRHTFISVVCAYGRWGINWGFGFSWLMVWTVSIRNKLRSERKQLSRLELNALLIQVRWTKEALFASVEARVQFSRSGILRHHECTIEI